MAMLERLRNAAADALMLFVVPCGVALLPWRLGFASLKRLARNERLYRLSVDPAWAAAREHCPGCDEREWKYRFRLLRLVDHTDVYLALLRGRRWRRRHVVEIGSWPAPGPCVFLTYHWGAGNFVWPRLRELGFAAHFLMQRPQGRSHGLTRLSHWFTHWRVGRAMRAAGSAGALYTGGSGGEIVAALKTGRCVVGMLDLPARPEQQSARVPLLGGRIRIPVGLARLAHEMNVEIAIFSFGLDFESGQRQLQVEPLPAGMPLDAVMLRYAAGLDARLRAAPEAWHMWREMPAMAVANDEKGASASGRGLE